ncbi:MAG TPA: Uma2 family endonuclease [Steroidobacteraceae bacterium]|nr:Uma2 family endonuclease [Steroidobacteraceae bacterium]
MIAVMQEDLVRRHRLTVHEYYRMAEVGLLAPDARVELIEGEIIDMAPSGTPHAGILGRLTRLLIAAAGTRVAVRVQLPLRLDEYSEPEPDFAVLKWREDEYTAAHPTPADTLLVVEVSQTSLQFDRQRKLPLYARHGIPEVWIVDLVNLRLHTFDSPQHGQYASSSTTPQPGVMGLNAVPDLKVDLTALFAGLQGSEMTPPRGGELTSPR